MIFAQEWSNLTHGNVLAAVGRTQYFDIYPDNRNSATKLFSKITGFNRAEREIARKNYGFSVQGSKNYPDVVNGASWKLFIPNR
jgi:hypothetical protein